MMYMVQLVQEGYQIDDTLRSQLQQDLQIKAKLRGRYNKVELIKSELAQLANDPSHSTIQMVCESLGAPPQHASDWIGAILETCGEMLSNAAKEKSIASEASMTNGNELSPPLYEFHKLLRAYAQVISHVASQTLLTGQIDEIVIHWLCNNPIVLEDMNQPCSWVPVFLAILVSYNAINLDNAIKRFALLWFEQVGHECQQYQTNGTPEEGRLVVFCQNLIVLVRLLIIQSSNNMTRLEGETFFMPWKLRIEEYYRLEVQRQSQLASSLDRIEPMFALMEKLVMIATNLPLSSSLLQDLVMLRADLLQIGWFRQACIRDLNGVYQRFAAREAEASIEKRMKKKMLCIVDELIGGSLYSERQTIDTNPDFVDKLRRVFSNVSQWNEAQCRVQINLLLDNISLSDGNYQNPNNPHILGDDVSMMDSMSTMPTANNNKDLESFVYFFYDIVLSDGKEEREHAKAQRRFQFFKNLIHEIREPVLLELLNHGARLLEGSNDQAFPENILLMQATEPGAMFDSCKYTYRAKAFLNITQHMLAENIWSNDQKIELVKTIFKQIVRFKSGLSVYKVMQGANVCYSDAYNALQLVKNNVVNILVDNMANDVCLLKKKKKNSLSLFRIWQLLY